MPSVRQSPSGVFLEIESAAPPAVAILDAEQSTIVTGPATFLPIPGLLVSVSNPDSADVVAELVVNSAGNNGFAIGLRIAYSVDGVVWEPLPGASLLDTDSSINRSHLVVMGKLEGVGGPTPVQFRAEWTAFGDSGTWTIPANENGSACIAAWLAS
jgi:hypothetical protein